MFHSSSICAPSTSVVLDMVLCPGFALSFSKGSNIYAVGLLFLRGVLCVCVWLKGGKKKFLCIC